MSNERNRLNDIYAILNAINEYVENSDQQILQYDNVKGLTSETIKQVNRKDEKENLETLSRLVVDMTQGRVSENVVRFYIQTQFGLENEQVDGLISSINAKFRNKNQDSSVVTFKEGFSYPKVSVVITTYNRKDYLIQAIDSLLMQDYPQIEITVIDDCSTDGTDSAMKEKYGGDSRIIYMRKEVNSGPGNNRREAFAAHADGEYVLFLDDDDYLVDENYLSKAVKFHIEHPEVSFVSANVFLEYSQKEQLKISHLGLKGIINKRDYLLNFERNGYPKPASTLTTVFKRTALIEMDILNMKMVNDASIYLRALLIGDAGIIDSIVGVYRIHGSNITFTLSKEFLVENLEEKLILKRMAVETYGFNQQEMDDWFGHAVYSTVSYYFYNSAKTKNDYDYVYQWTKENAPELYDKLKSEFRFVLFKRRLKKIPAVQTLRKVLKG